MELVQVCKDAVLANDSGLACAVVAADSDRELAVFSRSPEHVHSLRAFLQAARVLLGEQGRQALSDLLEPGSVSRGGDVHLAGDVLGYARLLPSKNVLLVLIVAPSHNVGLGWATLSVAASQLEHLL